jgi:hypothetical protein
MTPVPRAAHALRAALLAAAAALGACSSSIEEPPTAAGLACVDDSPRCMEARATALRSMMGDKSRAWIRQPASPSAYASGVRLFAFKQRKRDLSCEELAIGRREADQAGVTLRSPAGASLTPAQVARGAMLGSDVAKELAQEMAKRCRA